MRRFKKFAISLVVAAAIVVGTINMRGRERPVSVEEQQALADQKRELFAGVDSALNELDFPRATQLMDTALRELGYREDVISMIMNQMHALRDFERHLAALEQAAGQSDWVEASDHANKFYNDFMAARHVMGGTLLEVSARLPNFFAYYDSSLDRAISAIDPGQGSLTPHGEIVRENLVAQKEWMQGWAGNR